MSGDERKTKFDGAYIYGLFRELLITERHIRLRHVEAFKELPTKEQDRYNDYADSLNDAMKAEETGTTLVEFTGRRVYEQLWKGHEHYIPWQLMSESDIAVYIVIADSLNIRFGLTFEEQVLKLLRKGR